MSVEQWGVLAFIILVPLLEGLARLRRAHVTNDRPGDRVAQSPPLSPPPRLPQPAADFVVPLAPHPTSHTPVSNASASPEVQRPLTGDAPVSWLRSTRNLRRAIVVATILGPRQSFHATGPRDAGI